MTPPEADGRRASDGEGELTEVVGATISPTLDAEFQQVVDAHYNSRAEAVREAVRADGGGAPVPATGSGDRTDHLAALPPTALEDLTLLGTFERADQRRAVEGRITRVLDHGRRRLVLDDGSVVPVSGLTDYDLTGGGGEPRG